VKERKINSQGVTLEPEDWFVYRVLSTTVYVRNMAREEFG